MLIFSLIAAILSGAAFISSGSLAMLAAIRRASSRVSRLAADRRPGSSCVVVVPIRSGVGLRLGANFGYLKFSRGPTWNPF
jgi:Envelope integrity protein A